MKLIKDLFYESDELSLKRITVGICTIMLIDLYLNSIRGQENLTEGVLWVFGELLGAIFVLMGLAVANKGKQYRNSTNEINRKNNEHGEPESG